MAFVFALCAAYVAYCLGTNPAGPITTPDSIRYLNASPWYPIGYPLFLKLVGARGAIVAQPILFGAALAYLGKEIVSLTRSTWLALAVVAGSMMLPQIREFHASILSESLFLSLLTLFLALGVRFAYHPTWHFMVLIAMSAGLATTVRRTGFALVPVMLVMVLFQRRRLRGSQLPFFLVAAAPFVVIVAIEQAAMPVVHSGPSSSLMGRHMFAKAALIDAPPAFAKASTSAKAPADKTAGKPAADADPVRAGLDRHLENDYAPIRAFLASAPPDVRATLSINYETCLQGGCVDRSRELMPDMNEAEQTKTLGAAAMARIRRAPLAFARLTAMDYLSLWTFDRLHHPDRAPALNAFVAAHRPMPFEQLAFSLEPGHVFEFQGVERVRYLQWVMTAVAIATLAIAAAGIAAALARQQLPPLFAIAATAAVATHSGVLLTAILATGFSRFTQGLWPAIVMASVFGVWAVFRPGSASVRVDTAP